MNATLSSNRGDCQLALTFTAYEEYGADAGVCASVRLTGRHFDGEGKHDLSASLDALWLRLQDITEMREFIETWMDRPLAELATAPLAGEFQLARLPGQDLTLRFGPRNDTVATLNPIVTIEFSAGAFAGQFHYVTDQSCLRIFVEQLIAAVLTAPRLQCARAPNKNGQDGLPGSSSR